MEMTVGNWHGIQGLLAPRELEGVLHCANDRTVKEAAREMNISPATLKKRLESARLKLGAGSIRALVLEAFKRGLINPAATTLAVIMAIHGMIGDDHDFTRIRRGGGQGRKVELRVATRRAECALAVA
ncbi:LuxR C-terminal-related transcriptional regulator [Pseudomonas alloputida]|uniref:LuxR C-terminal-related transcriptional regulator n=1 Tax=Pseudomonas alloputida TaxID=1940621 RepID=A0AAW7HS48_9PSED|nr:MULTISPECIES: LuxR C-terminal-related transcriptional regulator [Pseudomonas]MBH3376147.1 helix-turn-helix transcriptional regulator [Pseudomonas juntendi]MBH3383168.1 helix-turn-helix transcriptional regulator [Pseudomonas juntendi]MBS6040906.1 helix-turn-helix transcriptional regulator [Pseudomonas sp.]MCE0864363.1 LuxR C-terminal-related transcriptional regulator [Pseudomonas alloputida]MCE0869232.1 LuxR C-terminal-related transcriptional regulator [Pseudomonas alloputida]